MNKHVSLTESYYHLSLPQEAAPLQSPADRALGNADAVESAKQAEISASVAGAVLAILDAVEDFRADLAEITASPPLHIKRLTSTAKLPTRGSAKAIGLDLYADLLLGMPAPTSFNLEVHLYPGNRFAVPTSVAVAVPDGFYGRVAPRSGLALKSGLDVLAGVVDADYRGEVKVILLNTGDEPFTIKHGDRIGQLILERAEILPVVEVNDLDATDRGAAGFGSTGVSLP